MIVHADDVFEMWCPFARPKSNDPKNPPVNMDEEGIARSEAGCVGTGCMAWRQTKSPGKGYCGLAGKPLSIS